MVVRTLGRGAESGVYIKTPVLLLGFVSGRHRAGRVQGMENSLGAIINKVIEMTIGPACSHC